MKKSDCSQNKAPHSINRRQFMGIAAAVGVSAMLPFPSFAKTGSDNIFIWVSLRGAMDGLNVVVPHADPDYSNLRPNIGLKPEQLVKLDDFFGLHPSLKQCHQWYESNELSFVHACSTAYRERSHFDGQKILENGTSDPFNTVGWINRLLTLSSEKYDGIAIDSGLPLIMQGESTVASWYPNRLKTRDKQTELLEELFQSDQMLSSNFESVMKIDQLVGDQGVGKQFKSLMGKTGDILSADNGPNIAALELGGWDTHANQGNVNGRLSNQLKTLDGGLAALKTSLGDRWQKTVIIAASEFGRTAKENGTKGTDHGTGNVMFVAGGALPSLKGVGGKVIANWPGLSQSQLYEGRDLNPTTDMRSVIKGVLYQHLSVEVKQLNIIFPDSADIRPMNLV
ncbi:DUF1501 domain-containing protein [Vibrio sp. 10N.222.51.C8]|uniref:DUF1501 domain-containing protein n=1 Tax=Vibrio TaxID=662 RepID=UPI000C818EF1|nr:MULTISPECIES: DUF1501 domain-containing protein [Vibrio]MCC4890822.1 DUF1501 domain-containing protein [Vibrio sp. F13]PMO01669.1 Tat pathway signal protein [Vibrio sp. 10N.222.55.C12]PMO02807.1 Tat pathway signal protein [Vibrio sp. 10N.222.55.F9]PMO13568.1 Tat pathway signal protein [Vibrio sp. 10N.222.54.F10]PMO14665.1 Tat pathway signal protein [Vibrio sp. 10N.222.54.B6]